MTDPLRYKPLKRLPTACFLLFIFCYGTAVPVYGQLVHAGNIERLAKAIKGGKRGETLPVTEEGEVERITETNPQWLEQGMDLFLADLIRVRGDFFIDVRLGNHRLVGANELDIKTLPLEQKVGIYQIRRGSKDDQNLEVLLTNGLFLADINPDERSFTSNVAGIRSDVAGTKVLFGADQVKELGFLYLKEGSVTFREFPNLTINPGDLWAWQLGAAPIKQNLTKSERKNWDKNVKHLDKIVWRPPMIKQPWFWAASVAVAGSLTCAILENCRCSIANCKSTGSITVMGGF